MTQFSYQPAYRRNLPHIQPAGKSFFLTFRLAASLPNSVVERWRQERDWLAQLAQKNPAHQARIKDDLERLWFAKFESLLDRAAVGPTWLSDPRVAATVVESLHHHDGEKYRLDAFTIMSNHVHAVIKPLRIETAELPTDFQRLSERKFLNDDASYHSLAEIMHSLKGYTAHECNRILGRRGQFWAHESFDRWIRDDIEWQRIIAYTLNNPLKAGLVKHWQNWQWSYRRT